MTIARSLNTTSLKSGDYFSDLILRVIVGKPAIYIVLGFVLSISANISCTHTVSTPKPKGYFRIDFPETSYIPFSLPELPCSFHVAPSVTIELPPVETSGSWINLSYPALNAKIYCSYQQISPADLAILDKECRELVSRNAAMADSILEHLYENQHLNVYGTLFRIKGETVSPVQFMLTDSSNHFFRGALYFEFKPNVDSLAPVTQYMTENIMELIQSFHWK